MVGPKWRFRPYGACGRQVSDLFPHLAHCVDDLAFVHSMAADSPLHGSAMLMMNSGRILSGAPCLGTWVNYGLGTENQNLPGFVVMLDQSGGPISGAKNWSSGFMPAVYQGTVLRGQGEPILDLARPEGTSEREQRRLLDALREQNEAHLAARGEDHDLAARIASFELAFRMQAHAPEAIDFASEDAATQRLYGLDEPRTADFGRKCLLARRLVERGVRFVQIYSGGNHNDHNWDAHGDLVQNHEKHAGATDRPIAGLLTDLKRRGLLDSTIVVWGGEFGRQPTAEYRGHRSRPRRRGLHDVARRRWHPAGHRRRRHRRTRLQGRRAPVPRQTAARDHPAPDGARPEPPRVPPRRARPAAGRHRRGAADPRTDQLIRGAFLVRAIS